MELVCLCVHPSVCGSVCGQVSKILISSLCSELLTLCVIFSSLQSCELMELGCLCACVQVSTRSGHSRVSSHYVIGWRHLGPISSLPDGHLEEKESFTDPLPTKQSTPSSG